MSVSVLGKMWSGEIIEAVLTNVDVIIYIFAKPLH